MNDEFSQQLSRRDDAVRGYPLAQRDGTALITDAPLGGERDDDDAIDLREYWHILLKRRWVVFWFFVVVVVAAAVITAMMTPMYQAQLTLQIERDTLKVTQFEGVTPTETGWNSNQFYRTQYELLKSRSLAERVVQDLDLDRHPAFKPQPRDDDALDPWQRLVGVVTGAAGEESGGDRMVVLGGPADSSEDFPGEDTDMGSRKVTLGSQKVSTAGTAIARP